MASKITYTNRVSTYFRSGIYFKMLIGYCGTQLQSRSDTTEEIIKKFFNTNFNEAQKNNLVKKYDSMTPEQRSNPRHCKDEF